MFHGSQTSLRALLDPPTGVKAAAEPHCLVSLMWMPQKVSSAPSPFLPGSLFVSPPQNPGQSSRLPQHPRYQAWLKTAWE